MLSTSALLEALELWVVEELSTDEVVLSVVDDDELSVVDEEELSVVDDELSVVDDDELSVVDDDELSVVDEEELSVVDEEELSVVDDDELSVVEDDEVESLGPLAVAAGLATCAPASPAVNAPPNISNAPLKNRPAPTRLVTFALIFAAPCA